MNDSHTLFPEDADDGAPVECLGKTFKNNTERRVHFLSILREKLKDPAFRKIEGFPIGNDDDILALSDPPYYTACPNPFIGSFVESNGKPTDSTSRYGTEPFASDVSEGKYDPIYKLHPYHTKVPHRAIMRYILHYTKPGDTILDMFCGTGMTGVAARECGNRQTVESLGYSLDSNGDIFEAATSSENSRRQKISTIGQRFAVLNDLSPLATFVTYKYNDPLNLHDFQQRWKVIESALMAECGWMYQTLHLPSQAVLESAVSAIESSATPKLASIGPTGSVNYVVWSDVFSCPECGGEIVFWRDAVDVAAGKVLDQFSCPHCSSSLTKRALTRVWTSVNDRVLGRRVKRAKLSAVRISYSMGTRRFEKEPDAADLALIKRIDESAPLHPIPSNEIPDGFNTRQPRESHGITHLHQFYTSRCADVLAAYRQYCKSSDDLFVLTRVASQLTLRYRFTYQSGTWGAGGGPMSGTLYIPSLIKELNPLEQLRQAARDQSKRLEITRESGFSITNTSSSTDLKSLPSESIDYIFIDPPFGSNIMYSELNLLWEGWLRIFTNNKHEAIENSAQDKGLDEYRRLMNRCFLEAFRVLKPGRWMTVEFSNTQASVWNAIQTALQEAGFVVANVSALDKQKASFKATTTTTAVKQDLVISAYKPNGGLEERFVLAAGTEDSAWDFVRTHLKYLPSIKLREHELEFIAERDPRVIFDRMVAYFVRHNYPVPLSSQEFQGGLSQRFAERDGMVFLPEQVAEYDSIRIRTSTAPQMDLFISDERSAIDWLTDFLRRKPSTYQEIHPEFIRQLGAGWKKHEAKPELSALLEGNFLRYDPKHKDIQDVPAQIHAYLSSNWASLRNLDKTDAALRVAATDRWYVPDPTKAQEIEKVRERALLKDFDAYKLYTGRKLKEFRLEVMRAGFKTCWGNRDYATIIAVAKKVPDEVLQEDEKLLLWYDQALTRMEEA